MTLAEFLALDAEARLAHLATLDAEGLAALEQELRDHFAELDASGDLSDENLAQMASVADARDAVIERQTALTAEVEAAEQRAAELRDRMAPPTDSTQPGDGDGTGGDGTSDGSGDGTGTSDGDGAGDGTSTGADDTSPDAVAAAGATATRAGAASGAPAPRRSGPAAMAARARTTTPAPQSQPRARVVLRSQPGIPNVTPGQQLDVRALGNAVAEAIRTSREVTDGRFAVAHGSWIEQYGDRHLRSGAGDNDRLMEEATSLDALVAAADAFMATNPSDAEALVAAGGGFCAPFPVDYDIPVEGSLDRPVRDALARFGADRGGIQFTPPPALMSGAEAGVGVWDATADEGVVLDTETGEYTSDAGVKPIVEFDCLDPVTEQVEAITQRASFANFTARFNPEQVAAHARLAMIAHARFAEARLLGKLWTRADFRVTTPQLLGAARDYFAMLDGLLPAIRYRRRLAADFPMRVIAPAWVRDMFRADMVRQMPTDDGDASMALADARLLAWARARRCNISWALDDRNDTAAYGRTQPTLAADGTGTAVLLDFPDVVESYVFPEGAVQFLDGGTLDLGVVRDARTNAVNRYETFAETWEGVAKRGTPLYAVRSTLSPTGTASALTAIGTADL